MARISHIIHIYIHQQSTDIPSAEDALNVSTEVPSKTETVKAVKLLKNGKSGEPGGIPPEAFKADIQATTEKIYLLMRKV